MRTSHQLSGRVAVVTGGCAGLGAQITHTLGGLGAQVVATSRDPATAARVDAMGEANISGKTLVFTSEAVNRFVEDVTAEFGQINILVNTVAGRAKTLPVEAIGVEDLTGQFADACVTAFLCAQAAVRHHAKTKIRSIVNIGSIY